MLECPKFSGIFVIIIGGSNKILRRGGVAW
jgi:hypothetical protein